jgi:hypothetical protein
MMRWLPLVWLAGRVLSQGPVPYDSTRTQVVLLGTGTPNAEPDRSGPALAVALYDHA